jgi:hypothetical protein
MFTAFYSFTDVHVVENALITHPELQSEMRFWTLVREFDTWLDAVSRASWEMFQRQTEVEMECYLNGELNYD